MPSNPNGTTTRIDLSDTAFAGTTRSYTYHRSAGADCCRSCGTSLAGRAEKKRWRKVAGVLLEITIYRCPCGTRRHVKREAVPT